jgi:hypothetical protein
VTKKLEGVPVKVDPGLELTLETEEFRIVKPVDTWAEVSPPTSCTPNRQRHVPVGLDSYSMIDLVSISFVKSLGLSPCDKKKHQYKEPMVEGIGRMKAKTYGFFHLRLCITDQWNQSIRFIRPFLAVDRSSRNSQVLLGRPALKDLRVNIDNVNDCWEIKNLPRVKPVSPSRFDREVLDGTQVFEVLDGTQVFEVLDGTQVFEVRVAYRPVSRLATVRSGPDRGLFWRLLKRLDCTVQSFVGLDWTIPKDRTV